MRRRKPRSMSSYLTYPSGLDRRRYEPSVQYTVRVRRIAREVLYSFLYIKETDIHGAKHPVRPANCSLSKEEGLEPGSGRRDHGRAAHVAKSLGKWARN